MTFIFVADHFLNMTPPKDYLPNETGKKSVFRHEDAYLLTSSPITFAAIIVILPG